MEDMILDINEENLVIKSSMDGDKNMTRKRASSPLRKKVDPESRKRMDSESRKRCFFNVLKHFFEI